MKIPRNAARECIDRSFRLNFTVKYLSLKYQIDDRDYDRLFNNTSVYNFYFLLEGAPNATNLLHYMDFVLVNATWYAKTLYFLKLP